MKTEHLTISELPLPPEQAQFVLEYCKDLSIHRAAAICNIDGETAYQWRTDPEVSEQILRVLRIRMNVPEINSEWLKQELYYTYLLSTQSGKLSVAMQCLNRLGMLGSVDAFAAEKVELKTDKDIVERLYRRRKFAQEQKKVVDFR